MSTRALAGVGTFKPGCSAPWLHRSFLQARWERRNGRAGLLFFLFFFIYTCILYIYIYIYIWWRTHCPSASCRIPCVSHTRNICKNVAEKLHRNCSYQPDSRRGRLLVSSAAGGFFYGASCRLYFCFGFLIAESAKRWSRRWIRRFWWNGMLGRLL